MLYKIKRFDLWVARWFIKSKYISLVNLLADDEVFPEYLTWRDVSDELARWALTWLDDSEARSRATAITCEVAKRRRPARARTGRPAHRCLARRDHRPGTPSASRRTAEPPIAVHTTRA